ncbi:hypothetical protein [Lactobacillus helveticus]|uniref:hypothetical protein n=1 Tax=Lactobacillus helveticus TaxID=1587 RepID=UPI0021A94B06|nr:hypothetical protein [Lactobacillus helveticus]MCT3411991.1 hypothetical protein [Lactobacillus helveticus]MCT3415515.1 hypothetical protein [Lactobacillus helveticus]MCT3426987.1 hypothetical protein [Lactobacillus helveticus]
MKPNTRILDYTALVQDGVLTLDDVPQDIAKEVTKWVRYLSGVTDNGMVKDEPVPTPTVQKTTVDTKPLLPKVGD